MALHAKEIGVRNPRGCVQRHATSLIYNFSLARGRRVSLSLQMNVGLISAMAVVWYYRFENLNGRIQRVCGARAQAGVLA